MSKNTPQMNLNFKFKIGPKLEDWFLNLGGVFFWVVDLA